MAVNNTDPIFNRLVSPNGQEMRLHLVTKKRNTIAPNIMYIKLKIDVFWSNNNSLPIRPPRTLPEWDPLRNKIRKYPPVQDSEQ